MTLKREINMTEGNFKALWKKVFLYSLPIILVGVLEILFNTFDLITIEGKEGELAAAAVGANAAFIALLTNVFIGLSTGENVVMARHYGRNDSEGGEKCASTGLLIAFIAGIIIALVGYFITPSLLKVMQVEDSYFDLAVTYLQLYFFAMPFMAIYNFGSATFRGMGDSTTPLIFLIIAGVVHIALDYLFVYGFNMSVQGVALSNIIAYALAAILVLLFLRYKKSFIKFRFKDIRFRRESALEILKIGIPSALEGMVFAISNILLQSSVNTWGSKVVEANADCENIENFVYTTTFCLAQGGAAFVSANYSIGKKKNVINLVKIIELNAFIVGLILGLIFLALNRPLIYAYSGGKADEELYSLCFERLVLLLSTYFLCGMMDGITNSLRGMNKPLVPMLITIFFLCIFRVFWNFVVYSPDVRNPRHSTILLYVCYPISWVMSSLFQLLYLYIKRKKISKELEENRITYQEKATNPTC